MAFGLGACSKKDDSPAQPPPPPEPLAVSDFVVTPLPRGLLCTFDTNRPAFHRISLGTAPGSFYGATDLSAAAETSHSVEIRDLSPGIQLEVRAEVEDEGGDSAQSDEVAATPGPRIFDPKKPIPVMYKMWDQNWEDLASTHPGWGPIGAQGYFVWEELHPASGPDFTRIEQWIHRAVDANWTITLPDGTAIPKPLIIGIHPFGLGSGTWPLEFYDYTPSWVYQAMGRPMRGGRYVGYVINDTGTGNENIAPMYDRTEWQNALRDFILALGAAYNGKKHPLDPNLPLISAVIFAPGFDSETQAAKNTAGGAWADILEDTYVSSDEYVDCVLKTMGWMAQAFPDTRTYIQNACGWNARPASSNEAEALGNIGIKMNGYECDSQSGQGFKYCSERDMFEQNLIHLDVPTAAEHRTWNTTAARAYAMIMNTLRCRCDFMDTIESNFNSLDGQAACWAFINDRFGRTLEDTPGVWCVMAETQHLKEASSGWEAGLYGDIMGWLYRMNDVPGGAAAYVPLASLPAAAQSHPWAECVRRTDGAGGNRYMAFDADDGYPYSGATPRSAGGLAALEVEVGYFDQGTDAFSIEYTDSSGTAKKAIKNKTGTGTWVKHVFAIPDARLWNALPDGSDFRLDDEADGPEYVHFVEVRGRGGWEKCAETATSLRIIRTANSTSLLGDAISLDVLLTDAECRPLSGRKVLWTVNDEWNLAEALETDAQGECTFSITLANRTDSARFVNGGGSAGTTLYRVRIHFQGDAAHAACRARTELCIGGSAAKTRITAASDAEKTRGETVSITATLTTEAGSPIAGETLRVFALGRQDRYIDFGPTDANGIAIIDLDSAAAPLGWNSRCVFFPGSSSGAGCASQANVRIRE